MTWKCKIASTYVRAGTQHYEDSGKFCGVVDGLQCPPIIEVENSGCRIGQTPCEQMFSQQNTHVWAVAISDPQCI